jgi:hypothetical protein
MLSSNQVIKRFIDSTNRNVERVKSTFAYLSEMQLNWKSAMNAWSIGECINHLITTNNLYLVKIENIINKSSNTSTKDFPYAQSFMGKLIAKGVDPSNIKKAKTFKAFLPDSSAIQKSVIEDYVNLSVKLIDFAKKMYNIDMNRKKLSSPVNFLIRMNLGDPLIIIPKHDERHLNQAERLIKIENFPENKL